jgi:nucleoside-diphosphate-sugar epimerase
MPSLVTGSNGFLGSRLVRRLVAEGEAAPICLVRPGSDTAKLERVSQELPGARIQLRKGDLGTVEAARRALDGADTVYHLAARLRGTPADMFLNTVVTSRNLLEAAIRKPRPPRLILVSSFSVYGVADLPAHSVITETSPLEPRPTERDLYAQVKLRQEQLFGQYQREHGVDVAVLRPGVIFGPESYGMSVRVGLQLPIVFLFLGGDNVLPLSYVDNCADALVLAGTSRSSSGSVINVHDDDLPTCRTFLSRYRREVRDLRVVSLPYAATMALSHANLRYSEASRGQLPAIFTPYKTRSSWKPMRYDNSRLHQLGWRQRTSTQDALEETFRRHREHWQSLR